jgi:fucose permease
MPQEHASERSPRLAVLLSYLGFVSLGLPDAVLGAAWPALRAELQLPLDAAGSAVLLTTLGVVVSSTAHGALVKRTDTALVLIGSTLLASVALLTIALSAHWASILAVSFVAGLGGGAIDASLNAYAARRYSARQMTWLHGFWGVGAALAPICVATALRVGASWRAAYGVMGGLELALALVFLKTRQIWRVQTTASAEADARPALDAVRMRWPMRASLLLFFGYGGLEAGTGLWSASFLVSTRAMSPASASAVVALYWGALTLGRFLIGARADALGASRVLRGAGFTALCACLLLAIPGTPTWLAASALCVLGLALAPIYPLTMHDTPRRFGAHWGTKLIGQHVAATTLGVATLPWLIGATAERSSLEAVPIMLALLALSLVVLDAQRRGRDRRCA